MYQLIGITSDEQIGGLGSLSNYTNEDLFSNDDPAINDHHYNINKQQHSEETHSIYIIDQTKTCNIKY